MVFLLSAASHSQKGGSLKDKRKMVEYEDSLFDWNWRRGDGTVKQKQILVEVFSFYFIKIIKYFVNVD